MLTRSDSAGDSADIVVRIQGPLAAGRPRCDAGGMDAGNSNVGVTT